MPWTCCRTVFHFHHWKTSFHCLFITGRHLFIALSSQKHIFSLSFHHKKTSFHCLFITETHLFITERYLFITETRLFIVFSSSFHHRNTCFPCLFITETHLFLVFSSSFHHGNTSRTMTRTTKESSVSRRHGLIFLHRHEWGPIKSPRPPQIPRCHIPVMFEMGFS